MKGYLCVTKPRGMTPLQLIEILKNTKVVPIDKKVSYAGRLDPMAEGLLILLVGDENKKRQEFESLTKEYVFDVLFGITTDTYDILGKIQTITPSPTFESLPEKLGTLLPTFLGKRQQPYPPYSSFNVQGKPLFYWARENRLDEITMPTKDITILSLSILSQQDVLFSTLLPEINEDIAKVSGDFRQKEIIALWQNLYKEYPTLRLPLFRFQVTCTSGTYVRSLAQQLGEMVGCGALAYRIKRTRVGPYTLSQALPAPYEPKVKA